MKTLTATLAAILLSLSSTNLLAMDGLADRINEERSYPEKSVAAPQTTKTDAR